MANTEILIVDNDPVICQLSRELLRDAGYTTHILHESRQVVQTVREQKPRAVLLDIMMPGVDGLTLCRNIKGDPELSAVKVIIVTGKNFEVERERAHRYGADLFLQKPYNINTFAQSIREVVGAPSGEGKKQEVAQHATVRVWGARAAGGAQKTPCVTIESGDKIYVFDAGTGIVDAGRYLLEKSQAKEIWVFLTHYHSAHIDGLGLFAPLREAAYQLHVGGPSDADKTLEACVRESLQGSFIANPKPIQAQISLYEFHEGDYDVYPGIRVTAFYTNHPTTTLGYVLRLPNHNIVYCPDSELFGDTATALQDYDESLKKHCREADLLIHDARYNQDDYDAKSGQGHSCLADTVDFAASIDVDRLLLFHQDAAYTDEDVARDMAESQKRLKEKGISMECQAAKEGLVIEL